jgi:transmembrane 9 superfamily member 2/4
MYCLRGFTVPLTLVAVSLLLLHSANAFYLPGVAPTVFKDDQEVTSYVSAVISPESTLQFDYYTVPFCRPSEVVDLAESLGEALVGDKAQTSPYKFFVNRNVNCVVLCRKQYTRGEMDRLADFALLEYRANMRLDNLPLAEMAEVLQEDSDTLDTEYFLGFPIALNSEDDERAADMQSGNKPHPTYYLANHLHFKIKIHPVTKSVVKGRHADGSLIVGFQVIPMSVKHTYDGTWLSEKENSKDAPGSAKNMQMTSCDENGVKFPHTQLALPRMDDDEQQSDDSTTEVIWTYDVSWEESDVEWASRWDVFLNMKGDKIRWVSIFNSLGVLLLLTGIVAALMLRILRKDLAAYNSVATDDVEASELPEETGWKLVYADVFRPPVFARAYAVLHGAGAQFFLLVTMTLAFAAFGFLSPSNRGSLLSAIVIFFALSGAPILHLISLLFLLS